MRRLLVRHSRCLTRPAAPSRYLRIPPRSSLLPSLTTTTASNAAVHHVSPPQTTTAAYFSTSSESNYPDHFHERVELDSSLPLSTSVNQLLRIPLGRIHRLDIYNKFPNVMRACCKAGKLENAHRLLERMLQEKRESGRVVPAKVFETLLFGHVKRAKKEPKKSIQQMKEILTLMEEEHDYDMQRVLVEEEDGDSCQPRTQTFNTVLRGMAQAATFLPAAAREAEALLDTMETLHRERAWHTKPNNRSFTYVISAYGNVKRHDSGALAEAVLDRMKQVHKLQVQEYGATHDVPYNEISPEEYKNIVTPDAAAYTAVIRAHAKSSLRESANRAYEVLTEMHNNVRPDAIAITTCINAFANVASRSSGNKRDRVSAQERAEAAQSAEALLLMMVDLAKEAENTSTTVEEETDDDLDDFDEWDDLDASDDEQRGTSLHPTVITYNSCLNAFSRSDTDESAPRAHALLQGMIEASLNDANAVKPNRTSFNTVMNAYARYSRYDPEAPIKAEELLNLMYELYYSGRLDNVKPDAVTYTTAINAWARSGDRPDKVQNARRLLDTMLSKYDADEQDMKPNIIAYTSVLNAAVHSPPFSLTMEGDGDQDPFGSESSDENVYSILLQTYDELMKDPYNIGLSPDHFVFATMLQAIRQHTTQTSAERRQMVETVFDDACAAGEVSAFVIRALREACPSIDLLERLLRSPALARELRDVGQLPQDWSRNLEYSPRLRKVDRGELRGRARQKKRQRGNNRQKERKAQNNAGRLTK